MLKDRNDEELLGELSLPIGLTCYMISHIRDKDLRNAAMYGALHLLCSTDSKAFLTTIQQVMDDLTEDVKEVEK